MIVVTAIAAAFVIVIEFNIEFQNFAAVRALKLALFDSIHINHNLFVACRAFNLILFFVIITTIAVIVIINEFFKVCQIFINSVDLIAYKFKAFCHIFHIFCKIFKNINDGIEYFCFFFVRVQIKTVNEALEVAQAF